MLYIYYNHHHNYYFIITNRVVNTITSSTLVFSIYYTNNDDNNGVHSTSDGCRITSFEILGTNDTTTKSATYLNTNFLIYI